ncbi:unnamed protein product, partial [Meganyctiphanes norvegica]
ISEPAILNVSVISLPAGAKSGKSNNKYFEKFNNSETELYNENLKIKVNGKEDKSDYDKDRYNILSEINNSSVGINVQDEILVNNDKEVLKITSTNYNLPEVLDFSNEDQTSGAEFLHFPNTSIPLALAIPSESSNGTQTLNETESSSFTSVDSHDRVESLPLTLPSINSSYNEKLYETESSGRDVIIFSQESLPQPLAMSSGTRSDQGGLFEREASGLVILDSLYESFILPEKLSSRTSSNLDKVQETSTQPYKSPRVILTEYPSNYFEDTNNSSIFDFLNERKLMSTTDQNPYVEETTLPNMIVDQGSPGKISATEPYIDRATPVNVVAHVGSTAIMTCLVNNLGQRSVSWVRHRDIHVMTVGRLTFTNDDRFEAHNEEGSNEWLLALNAPGIHSVALMTCNLEYKEPKKQFLGI